MLSPFSKNWGKSGRILVHLAFASKLGDHCQPLAAKMGKPVYVEFHSAKNGEEARCHMNKRSNSRRVQFKAPGTDGIEDAPDGSKVKYRYTEDGNADGKWELLEVSGSRSS